MPFTAKLGTADSRPGNVVLGRPSGPAIYEPEINDTLTFTDVMVGVNIEISDTLVFTDMMTPEIIVTVTTDDTLTFSDIAASVQVAEFSDTLVFTDTMEAYREIDPSWEDTVVFSDTLTVEFIATRVIFDALNYADVAARTIIRLLEFTDTLVPEDEADGYVPKLVEDTLTFAETWTPLFSKGISSLLEFAESYTANAIFQRLTASVLELYDAIQLQIIARREISETLTFSESMLGYGVKPISELLTLADEFTYTISKLATDTLTFTDDASYFKTLGVSGTDVVVFTDTMAPTLVIAAAIAETLSLTDSFLAIRAQFASASDTVSFTDTVYREIREATAPDILTLVETYTGQKIGQRTIEETLVFSDTMGHAAILLGSASDSVRLVDRMYAVVSDQFMVFIGEERAVVVPPPEWNDYEADRAQVIFKRKMGGSVTTYVKTTQDQKIHYEFVIPRPKALELREFLDAENGRQFTIYDWKGQVWLARLSTDTVERAELGRWEPCGNKTRVALEFIGARYA
jgi:hypothetical protein